LGIYLEYSNSNIMVNNIINENNIGIIFPSSDLNIITDNNIESNEGGSGIFLMSSNSNTIENNILNNNGIYLYDSDLNTITDNNIENNRYGIFLSSDSNTNTITDNDVENNRDGISLRGSENIIDSNIFCYNDGSDIEVTGDNNQFIYNQCDNIEGEKIECISCDVELEKYEIELNPSWNLISSYIILYFNDMESIFNRLVRQNILEIVKDGNGRFYIPENDFDNIGEWISTEGYWVKVNEPATLTIIGEEHTPLIIKLNEGWNTIAYPLRGSNNVRDLLNPLVEDNLLEIIKDGFIRFYLPRYGFDNLENMNSGKGYIIKVSEDAVLNFDVVFNH